MEAHVFCLEGWREKCFDNFGVKENVENNMNSEAYALESAVEESHWWFVVRRKLIKSIIIGHNLPKDTAILDIGSSTGTNLRMLKEMGFLNYQGIDVSDEAIFWCAQKKLGRIHKGDVCALSFQDSSFDLILATDIIEHVEEDGLALKEIDRVLKPGSSVIITVPAFNLLWGIQDDIVHHKRRYTKKYLFKKISETKLSCQESFYFNFFLFLPILIARTILKVFKKHISIEESQINNNFINKFLKIIFTLDIYLARFIKVPFGVSLLAVAKKGNY